MNKKCICIMGLLLMFVSFCNSVDAEIISFTDYVGGKKSSSCAGEACANTIGLTALNNKTSLKNSAIYGVRATLIDSTGKQVAGTQVVNIWATGEMLTAVKNSLVEKQNYKNIYENNTATTSGKNKNGNEYIPYIGLPNSNGETGVNVYKSFVNNLTSSLNASTRVERIVNAVGSNKISAMNYYLKLEPIYVLHEKYYNNHYYYAGTSLEIINYFLSKDQSYGNGYIAGGCGQYNVGGAWNVIRNYVVSMYFSKENKEGSGLLVSAYDSKTNGYLSEKYHEGSGSCTRSGYIPPLITLYKNGNGLGVGYIKVSEYLEDTCESNFDALSQDKKNDKITRIKLYQKWLSKGEEHRNLLNFSKDMTATEACGNPSNCDTASSCLNVSNNIRENDWSCYNRIDNQSGILGYCVVGFSFSKDENIPVSDITDSKYKLIGDSFTKAGQFIFKNKFLGASTLTQSCIYETALNRDISVGTYKDYVSKLSFNENELTTINEDESMKLNCSSNVCKGSITASYDLPNVYVYRLSGKKCNLTTSSCLNIGHGIISQFKDAKSKDTIKIDNKDYLKLPFKIEFNKKSYGVAFDKNISSNSCVYSVEPEIIKYNNKPDGELSLEFRTIDINNPFPGKDGNSRNVGSNWCSRNAEGTIESCSGIPTENKTIETYIVNKNNSNNIKQEGAKYTITLTPSIIKKIRNYNKENPYEDFNFVCNNEGNNCDSEFLKLYKFKN